MQAIADLLHRDLGRMIAPRHQDPRKCSNRSQSEEIHRICQNAFHVN